MAKNPIAGVSTVARLRAREARLADALLARGDLALREARAAAARIREVADHYPEAAALTLTEARARHFTERQEIAWQLRFAADPLDLRQLARRLQMGSV